MKDYTFLTRPEYFKALTEAACQAERGQRVTVTAMDIDPSEPMIVDLLRAMQTAARGGASVQLIVDAHNFLQAENIIPGPLFFKHSLDNLRGKFSAILQLLRELEAAGGTFHITNIPRHLLNPSPIGRSHIKGAVVGNQVFIGGCNLEHPEYIDLMVTWRDMLAADTLASWFRRMTQQRRVRDSFSDVDIETRLDDATRLILDAGVPGQSLIYDEALQLIDEAKEWIYMTCQYFPGGPTAKHLAAARTRGVHIETVFSNPHVHGASATLHRLHQLQQHTRGLPHEFFAGKLARHLPKLHAKILASEHEVMVGSHNYVVQGVQFGTAEIALHSTDPAFALATRAFIKDQIRSASRPATGHVTEPVTL